MWQVDKRRRGKGRGKTCRVWLESTCSSLVHNTTLSVWFVQLAPRVFRLFVSLLSPTVRFSWWHSRLFAVLLRSKLRVCTTSSIRFSTLNWVENGISDFIAWGEDFHFVGKEQRTASEHSRWFNGRWRRNKLKWFRRKFVFSNHSLELERRKLKCFDFRAFEFSLRNNSFLNLLKCSKMFYLQIVCNVNSVKKFSLQLKKGFATLRAFRNKMKVFVFTSKKRV